MYFELTNIAETNHRKRRRRASQLSPDSPAQAGTFKGTLQRARKTGIGLEDMLHALHKILVIPVFTAHPTGGGAADCPMEAAAHRRITGRTRSVAAFR